MLSGFSKQHFSKVNSHVADMYGTSSKIFGTGYSIGYLLYREESYDKISFMTKFGSLKFAKIALALRASMLGDGNTGLGRKISSTGKDVLFGVLTVLEHGQKQNFTAYTHTRMIKSCMSSIFKKRYEIFVKHVKEK